MTIKDYRDYRTCTSSREGNGKELLIVQNRSCTQLLGCDNTPRDRRLCLAKQLARLNMKHSR